MCQSVCVGVGLCNSSEVFKNSRLKLKCTSKCLGIFPKNQGGGIGFQDWGQNSLFSNNQHLLILLDLCIAWCGSVKCSFSVCSVISLYSCLTVNNCIGNILGFPEFLHINRSFLSQSNCRTFQTSILKKQAILNMYLDIIKGLEILVTNELINCFCLVMVNSGVLRLCLDQSNSKILETPITQEKF